MDWFPYIYFSMGVWYFLMEKQLLCKTLKCQTPIKRYGTYIRITACHSSLVLWLLCYTSRCIIFICFPFYMSYRLSAFMYLSNCNPHRFWLFWLDWQCPSRCRMWSFHPRGYNHQKQKCSRWFTMRNKFPLFISCPFDSVLFLNGLRQYCSVLPSGHAQSPGLAPGVIRGQHQWTNAWRSIHPAS